MIMNETKRKAILALFNCGSAVRADLPGETIELTYINGLESVRGYVTKGALDDVMAKTERTVAYANIIRLHAYIS